MYCRRCSSSYVAMRPFNLKKFFLQLGAEHCSPVTGHSKLARVICVRSLPLPRWNFPNAIGLDWGNRGQSAFGARRSSAGNRGWCRCAVPERTIRSRLADDLMQSDNKGRSPAKTWAELSLITAAIVIAIALAWAYVW